MIQVLDNVVSKRYQDEIEYKLLYSDYRWVYTPTIVDCITKQGKVFGFGGKLGNHKEGTVDKENFNFLLPLTYDISEKSGIEYESILAARTFLQVPSTYEKNYGPFHVDFKYPHIVFLYYVNDSDGDTLITKKKYDFSHQTFDELDDSEIISRVTPKKGRVVVFDGLYYHSGGIPKNNSRCVINFNLSLGPLGSLGFLGK
jgi:hypothetical protein